MKLNFGDVIRPDEVQYYDWRLARWLTSETRDRLDCTGRGIYRELLDHCYAQGSFPDDAAWIIRKCACSMRDYQKWWPVVERHFPKLKGHDGYRHNVFADIFRRNYFSMCKANRKNGKIGGIKSGESKKMRSARSPDASNSDSDRSSLRKGKEGKEGKEAAATRPVVEYAPPESPPPPTARELQDELRIAAAANGNGNGHARPPDCAVQETVESHEQVRSMLADFPGANILPTGPDDAIIAKCFVLARGDPNLLALGLKAMYRDGKSPGKSWAYFPTVLRQYLSGDDVRARLEAGLRPPL